MVPSIGVSMDFGVELGEKGICPLPLAIGMNGDLVVGKGAVTGGDTRGEHVRHPFQKTVRSHHSLSSQTLVAVLC